MSPVPGGLWRGISFSPDFLCCPLSVEFLQSESSHLNAVYRLSLLVEGPPSPLCCCLPVLFSFVSWAASPHKASLSFGGGESEASCVGCLVLALAVVVSLVFVFVFLVLSVVFLSSVVFPQ